MRCSTRASGWIEAMSDCSPARPLRSGRSLWQDARARLSRNRAAVVSLIVLALIGIACLFGPFLTGHAYDHAYQNHVRVPASFEAHPKPDALPAAIERIAARIRATPGEIAVGNGIARLTLTAQRPIDPRLLAFFARSDQFGAPRVLASEEDGRRLTIEVPVKRLRFLFGTDANGRDLLTRTLVAGRISLAIGLLATGVALVIGVIYGATAGYLGGRIDMVMMRIVDVLYALPFIFLAILLVVFFGRHFVLVFLAVGAVEWLDMARIVRGQTLSIKRRDYVLAAEALGVTTGGIVARHIIPNTLGPVIVYVTLLVPKVILLESFLSFLGLGVQEPMTSWGVLISDGARAIEGAPWLLIFPSAFLVATLFALNFLGDGLRDALDPKDR
jgi:oligopeptide transport system permease protein